MAGKTTYKAQSTRAGRRSLPRRDLDRQEGSGLRSRRPSTPALLEGCWLALALLTPALFDPTSLRVFEAEKVAFVRAVAIAMVALWAVERLADRSSEFWVLSSVKTRRFKGFRTWPIPLVTPALVLMTCYLLASLFSELPGVAVFGSYRRQFGLVTHLSFAVIFLAVATHLRTPAQGRRLLYTIALGALIPSLYAVLQKLGVDPIPWSVDHSRRVVGTLGQPTFLGAYLAAVVPVSLWIAIGGARVGSRESRVGARDSRTRRREEAEHSIPHLLSPIPQHSVLALLLGLQMAALLFSESRGAWAGAAVGMLLVLVLSEPGRVAARRAGIRRVAAIPLAGLAMLVALNLSGSPLRDFARQVPYLERLATLGEFESGSGRVRAVIWQAMPALIAEQPLFGHGPDVMGYAFERHYPPELAYAENRTAAADQAHNILLQQLAIAGVPGLAAFLWLVVAVSYRLSAISRAGKEGKEASDLAESTLQRGVDDGSTAHAGTVATLPNRLKPRFREAGQRGTGPLSTPTLPLTHSLFHPSPFTLHPSLPPSVLIPAAGGLAGFLVEQLVGVQSVSSSLVFWLLLGLVAAYSRGEERASGRVGEWVSGRRRWGVVGIAVFLVAAGVWHLSILPLAADVRAASASDLAAQSRFEEAARAYGEAISLHPEAEYYLLLGQMATDVAERGPASDREQWLLRAEAAMAQAEAANPRELDVALAQGRLYGLEGLEGREGREGGEGGEGAYARALGISPNRSYVHNRLGALLAAQGRHAEAIERYRISLALDPAYAATHAYLADSLLATDRSQEALGAYLEAERLDPSLILVHINLAELYLRLGGPQQAVSQLEAAVRLAPNDGALKARLEELRRLAP